MSDLPRILIIDDDRILRTLLQHILQQGGPYDVRLAESGEEGLELARTYRPDLILCDIVMRGLHGYSTVASLREIGELQRTPIAMITGKGSALAKRRALEHGADYFLKKPFKPRETLQAVRYILEKHAASPPSQAAA